mmetsp:Transcript_29147/g.77340  ORF Transcript_29147/g.77340 Transcript_29147/m.77340 type:complete len:211 (+) Transcript_29147:522-1154(+)
MRSAGPRAARFDASVRPEQALLDGGRALLRVHGAAPPGEAAARGRGQVLVWLREGERDTGRAARPHLAGDEPLPPGEAIAAADGTPVCATACGVRGGGRRGWQARRRPRDDMRVQARLGGRASRSASSPERGRALWRSRRLPCAPLMGRNLGQALGDCSNEPSKVVSRVSPESETAAQPRPRPHRPPTGVFMALARAQRSSGERECNESV